MKSVRSIVIDKNFDRIDLSKAYFLGIDFQEANLKDANLRGANLCAANLSKVQLEKADLQGAFYNLYTQFPPNFNPKEAHAIERINEYLSDKTLLFVSQSDRDNSSTESDRVKFFNFKISFETIFLRLKNFILRKKQPTARSPLE